MASTNLFDLSKANSATLHCSSTDSSKVDENTSPCTERRISVTSSGLSPINTTMSVASGIFSATLAAICFNIVVLPALGGDTINPLCPNPIGENKSIIREDNEDFLLSKIICFSGKIGVKASKAMALENLLSLSCPLIWSTLTRPKYLSPSFGGLT